MVSPAVKKPANAKRQGGTGYRKQVKKLSHDVPTMCMAGSCIGTRYSCKYRCRKCFFEYIYGL